MKKILLINDTSHEAHIGSRSVINTIKILCQKYQMELFGTYTRAQVFEEYKTLRQDMDKADIIVINGEGSLHNHPRIATQFFPQVMKKIPNGKKTVLINALWQNMNYSKLAHHLNKIQLFSVRESLSYQDIIKQVDEEKVLLVPDLIFYNKFENIDTTGYCDSVDKIVRSTFKRKSNYFPLNFIDSGTYLQPKTLTYPSLEAYINWLKTLNLFITGRFHGACLSILAETPFLALKSNSHKIEGLVKDLGHPKLILRDLQEIKVKGTIANNAVEDMKTYKAEALKSIDTLFERISEL